METILKIRKSMRDAFQAFDRNPTQEQQKKLEGLVNNYRQLVDRYSLDYRQVAEDGSIVVLSPLEETNGVP